MNHTQTNTSKNQAEISSQGEISREGTSEESAKDILQAEKDSSKSIDNQAEISREDISEEAAKDILQAEKDSPKSIDNQGEKDSSKNQNNQDEKDSPKVQESQDVEIKILKGEETSPQDTKGMDTFTIQNLNFNVNYGFGGFVKMGQHFRVQCKISNLGEERDGVFQVIIPGEENNNGVYQQTVHLEPYETKNVELVILMNGISDQFQYRFINEENKTIVEKTATVKLLEDSRDVFFGILTKEQKEVRYLEDGNKELYYLSQDTIPEDSLALESLDGIIIGNYNVEKLSKLQYNAILQWVKEGGSLILDHNSQKYFNISQTTPQNKFFTKHNVEFGTVLILNQDLNTIFTEPESVKSELWKEMIRNLGESKLVSQNKKNVSTYYNYRIKELLSIPNSKEIPKVGSYGVVLGVYILLIGPVLYLVLKKKDKRHLTWILVPGIAITFTIIIYLVGSTTRITKPFGKHLTFTILGEDGTVVENTYFSLTSPYNNSYEVSFDDNYNVSILSNQYGYMDTSQIDLDYSGYTQLVNNNEKETRLFLKDFASFKPLYFSGRKTTTQEGRYDYHIEDHIEEITGEFTNHLGYDLEYTGIMCNGTMLPIGKIKNGETVPIKSTLDNNYATINSVYFTDVIDQIAGGSYQSEDSNTRKRYNALAVYLEDSMINLTNNNYLIGFPKKSGDKSIMDSLNIKSQGVEVVVIPLDIASTHEYGEESIRKLDEYATDTDGYSIDIYRYMPEETIDIRYTFGNEDRIKEINKKRDRLLIRLSLEKDYDKIVELLAENGIEL